MEKLRVLLRQKKVIRNLKDFSVFQILSIHGMNRRCRRSGQICQQNALGMSGLTQRSPL